MKISLPFYLVALGAAFLYQVIYYFVPTLPITSEQVLWVIVTILAALNVDVTQALRKAGTLR